MTAFLNPWFLLGALLTVLGAFGFGYASNDGADKVTAAWAQADKVATEARAKRIATARQAEATLQAAADEDRRKTDEKNKRLSARVAALADELRKRPERPAEPRPANVPQPAASAGAQGGGCTGAGLYRSDAMFLVGKSELYQRIRNQRDDCYAQYERAREALKQRAAGQ